MQKSPVLDVRATYNFCNNIKALFPEFQTDTEKATLGLRKMASRYFSNNKRRCSISLYAIMFLSPLLLCQKNLQQWRNYLETSRFIEQTRRPSKAYKEH